MFCGKHSYNSSGNNRCVVCLERNPRGLNRKPLNLQISQSSEKQSQSVQQATCSCAQGMAIKTASILTIPKCSTADEEGLLNNNFFDVYYFVLAGEGCNPSTQW